LLIVLANIVDNVNVAVAGERTTEERRRRAHQQRQSMTSSPTTNNYYGKITDDKRQR